LTVFLLPLFQEQRTPGFRYVLIIVRTIPATIATAISPAQQVISSEHYESVAVEIWLVIIQ
jgi:hypothetical protein